MKAGASSASRAPPEAAPGAAPPRKAPPRKAPLAQGSGGRAAAAPRFRRRGAAQQSCRPPPLGEGGGKTGGGEEGVSVCGGVMSRPDGEGEELRDGKFSASLLLRVLSPAPPLAAASPPTPFSGPRRSGTFCTSNGRAASLRAATAGPALGQRGDALSGGSAVPQPGRTREPRWGPKRWSPVGLCGGVKLRSRGASLPAVP